MKRFFPNSVTLQLILLLMAALTLSQVLNLYFLIGERQASARDSHFRSTVSRLVEEADQLVQNLPDDLPYTVSEGGNSAATILLSTDNRAANTPDMRKMDAYADKLSTALSEADITFLSTDASRRHLEESRHPRPYGPPPPRRRGPPPDDPFGFDRPSPRDSGPPAEALTRKLQRSPGLEEIVLSVELEKGVWLNITSPYYSSNTLTFRAVLTTASILIVSIIGLILIARRISKPIRELGIAAEALGRGEDISPLPETGPTDVRLTAIAFNTMQLRLTRTIEQQRVTLRALGHDLRTPLTSLRIRAEDIPKDAGRENFIKRVDDLAEMTNAILGWARDATTAEATASVDLTSLVDSIAQDYADRGEDVVFQDPGQTIVTRCRRVALRRAIVNLVDNALKYGEQARLTLTSCNNSVLISVKDNGPGIPTERLEDVLTPFTRLEESRNRDTGGMGLGLSIVQSVVQNHGGTLKLSNEQEGGLNVSISLPKL